MSDEKNREDDDNRTPEASTPCPCAHAPCIHDRNRTIAELREQVATLRSVPTGEPGEVVCVDSDCPYPEHLTDCPPPVEEQWEHLAKIRARHIEVLHRMLHERDEVIASLGRTSR